MSYDLNKTVSRMGTHSVKWEHMPPVEGKKRDELLPLWIADMDFPCAEPVLDAMHKRVDRQIFGYSAAEEETYLNSVKGWFSRRFGWEINTEHIQHAPGIVPALAVLVKAFSEAGDGIIIQQPIYYPFMSVIKANGRELLNNALIEKDGEYFMDYEDLEEKASLPSTRMILFCSPHNPVGRVWKEDELKKMAEICLKHDVLIISDEIHCDIVREGVNHIPLDKLMNDDRIISCTAASKSFNLAGMQTSNIILKTPELRKAWGEEILGRSCLFGANPIGIVATKAAYDEGEAWLDQVNAYIDDNLKFVGEYLKEHMPEAKYRISEGTYFAWIDFRAYGYSAEELEERVQKRGGVLLDEGYIFGEEGSGWERINVACPRSILEECLKRMKEVILN